MHVACCLPSPITCVKHNSREKVSGLFLYQNPLIQYYCPNMQMGSKWFEMGFPSFIFIQCRPIFLIFVWPGQAPKVIVTGRSRISSGLMIFIMALSVDMCPSPLRPSPSPSPSHSPPSSSPSPSPGCPSSLSHRLSSPSHSPPSPSPRGSESTERGRVWKVVSPFLR